VNKRVGPKQVVKDLFWQTRDFQSCAQDLFQFNYCCTCLFFFTVSVSA